MAQIGEFTTHLQFTERLAQRHLNSFPCAQDLSFVFWVCLMPIFFSWSVVMDPYFIWGVGRPFVPEAFSGLPSSVLSLFVLSSAASRSLLLLRHTLTLSGTTTITWRKKRKFISLIATCAKDRSCDLPLQLSESKQGRGEGPREELYEREEVWGSYCLWPSCLPSPHKVFTPLVQGDSLRLRRWGREREGRGVTEEEQKDL